MFIYLSDRRTSFMASECSGREYVFPQPVINIPRGRMSCLIFSEQRQLLFIPACLFSPIIEHFHRRPVERVRMLAAFLYPPPPVGGEGPTT